MSNVILIGMPGCGKSTVGVLLAKALGLAFVDTDVVFQAQAGKKLQKIIEETGIDAFLAREEEVILGLSCDQTVIATGGSVVYGARAMAHLHAHGAHRQGGRGGAQARSRRRNFHRLRRRSGTCLTGEGGALTGQGAPCRHLPQERLSREKYST